MTTKPISFARCIYAAINGGEEGLAVVKQYIHENADDLAEKLNLKINFDDVLSLAIYHGQSSILEELLATNCTNIKEGNNYNYSLMHAIRQNYQQVIQILLPVIPTVILSSVAASIPLNQEILNLVLASHSFDPEFLSKKMYQMADLDTLTAEAAATFLKHGARMNYQESYFKTTCLMLAAENGNISVVRYLLSQGADITLQSREDKTALEYAEMGNWPDIVELLQSELQKSQPPSFQSRLQKIGYEADCPGELCCPISHCLMNDPVTVSSGITYDRHSLKKYFIHQGNTNTLGCPVTKILIHKKELTRRTNQSIRKKIQDFVKKQEKNAKDKPLVPIVAQASMQVSRERFEYALSHGGPDALDIVRQYLDKFPDDLNFIEDIEYSLTHLMRAAEHGHDDLVNLLLSLGTNPNQTNEDGETALFFACRFGNERVVEVLLAYEALIDVPDEQGVTPFMVACESGYFHIAALLLKKGASPRVADVDGVTPLLLVCQSPQKNDALVLSMIKSGADVNAADGEGFTPLMAAAASGHLSTIEILLAHGADLTQKDISRCTALYYAEKKGYLDVVEMLYAHLLPAHSQQEPSYVFQDRLDAITYRGKIPSHLRCPLSKKILNDPITTENGITYDRASLTLAFKEGRDVPDVMRHELYGKTNILIKNMVEEFVLNKEKISQNKKNSRKRKIETQVVPQEQPTEPPVKKIKLRWPSFFTQSSNSEKDTVQENKSSTNPSPPM